MAALLEIDDIQVFYDKIQALKGISLEVREGRSLRWSAATAPASRPR